jgi:glucose-1-phosphate cytidylyltransferase
MRKREGSNLKVVLFCGGLGYRLRDHVNNVPKPMVPIGSRPIIWHLMRYYAHYGHKDFILCLGYGGDVIKRYFLNYEEAISNDFVLSEGGKKCELLNTDTADWSITFADTGLNANIGQRLKAVEGYLEGEDVFLANYADGLTDMLLPDQIRHFHESGRAASFLAVKPNLSYHFATFDDTGHVSAIKNMAESDVHVNGGFFIFKKEIFDYMRDGEELVLEPFQRLIKAKQLLAYQFSGFWVPMDTAKDKSRIDDLCATGKPPWQAW